MVEIVTLNSISYERYTLMMEITNGWDPVASHTVMTI